MEKLNKRELVDALVEKTGWTRKQAEEGLAAVVNTISDAVAEGDRVQIPGFGTFEKRDRAARDARNPQTGDTIKIKATSVPAFKAGSGFKTYVAASKQDQATIRKERA